MSDKLLVVRYLGFSSEGLSTIGKRYAYTVKTRKSIKKDDFIVLADASQNDDRNTVSTVRVMQVLDENASPEEVDKAISECAYDKPREKLFVGKAELKDYFAEVDRKRKRKELNEQIEERFKEAEKMALYQKLAETDPEMKRLLSELAELND